MFISKPKILVTGAGGQLGKEIRIQAVQHPSYDFIFLTREDLAIHHFEMMKAFFQEVKPTYCINCAAYTAVDKAETEKEQAMLVNAESVGVLASICKMFNTRFIHISTDYVFDGTATSPYKEEDPTNPVNYYGLTKLKGEALCLLQNPDSIIIRTAWVYSEFGNNFVKTMLRLMKERDTLNVVNDQLGSPTYAADLASLVYTIIINAEIKGTATTISTNGSSQHAHTTRLVPHGWVPGIYHYSNDGVISWYDFAVAIRDLSGRNCQVNPIPTTAYPTPAKRPAYSVFNKDKIKAVYHVNIPSWKDSLQTCISRLRPQL